MPCLTPCNPLPLPSFPSASWPPLSSPKLRGRKLPQTKGANPPTPPPASAFVYSVSLFEAPDPRCFIAGIIHTPRKCWWTLGLSDKSAKTHRRTATQSISWSAIRSATQLVTQTAKIRQPGNKSASKKVSRFVSHLVSQLASQPTIQGDS